MAVPIHGALTSDIINKITTQLFNDPISLNTSALTWDSTPEGAVKAKLWITNDGKVLLIKDMDSSHIYNTIRWILRNRSENLDESFYIETLKNLRNELKSR